MVTTQNIYRWNPKILTVGNPRYLPLKTQDTKIIESEIKKSDQNLKPLSEIFKSENKWTCDGCLVLNNNTIDECTCCKKPKPGSNKSADISILPNKTDQSKVENETQLIFGGSNNPPPAFSASAGLFSFGTQTNIQIGLDLNSKQNSDKQDGITLNPFKQNFEFGSTLADV